MRVGNCKFCGLPRAIKDTGKRWVDGKYFKKGDKVPQVPDGNGRIHICKVIYCTTTSCYEKHADNEEEIWFTEKEWEEFNR